MEVSKVPMFLAKTIVSSLSNPASGRSIGIFTASSMAFMFPRVCEATWPIDSPVIKTKAFSFSAIFSAILNINLR